jgi:hypothetical protein
VRVKNSILGKSGLVVAPSKDASGLVGNALRQIGLSDIALSNCVDHAASSLSGKPFDFVVCCGLPDRDVIELVRQMRWGGDVLVPKAPLICINRDFSTKQMDLFRDAGINIMATPPITMRSMLKHVTRALEDRREYISSSTYRGPCRRLQSQGAYGGPLRRATDGVVWGGGAPSQPLPLSPPVAPAKAPAKPGRSKRRAEPDLAEIKASLESDPDCNPVQRQTGVVIADICTVLTAIQAVFGSMTRIECGAHSALLTKKISCEMDRMINLMMLAAYRVSSYGCTARQLERLSGVKTYFVENMAFFIGETIQAVIAEGDRIVSGEQAVSIGIGISLTRDLAMVDTLILSIGGADKVESELIGAILQAAKVVAKVRKLAEDRFHLPDFGLCTNKV